MPRPVGRLVSSADFERLLQRPPAARSAHFAVHHLRRSPARAVAPGARQSELSTGAAPQVSPAVDDLPPSGLWLGVVVPKRHAKRSVTRSLVKRQIRAAVDREADGLPDGLWVVRLKQRLDTNRFPSAASAALRASLRQELDQLVSSARARSRGAAA